MISFGIRFFLGKVFGNRSVFAKIFFEILSVFFTIVLIHYAGQSFDFKGNQKDLEMNSLFVFLIVGEISLVIPMSISERIIAHFQEIRHQQFFQTLMGLKISPMRFVLMRVMVDSIFPFCRVVLILLYCAFFSEFHFTFLNTLNFFLIQILAIVTFIFMGLLAILIYLKFNRGIGLFYSLQSIAAIIGGLYFPVKILPAYIKDFSMALPQTQILKASREIFQSQKIDLNSCLILVLWPVFLSLFHVLINRVLIANLKKKSQLF